MATFYLDSSAVVKLYVAEPGSQWVESLVTARADDGRPAHVVTLSKVGVVEVAAAVARRGREGSLDAERQAAILNAFLADCERRFFTLAVLDDQLRLAVALLRRQPLRGYDAVHLASALDLDRHLRDAGMPGLTFVAADSASRAAAQAEGLVVVDPSDADALRPTAGGAKGGAEE